MGALRVLWLMDGLVGCRASRIEFVIGFDEIRQLSVYILNSLLENQSYTVLGAFQPSKYARELRKKHEKYEQKAGKIRKSDENLRTSWDV